jgi:hypothetical protein
VPNFSVLILNELQLEAGKYNAFLQKGLLNRLLRFSIMRIWKN